MEAGLTQAELAELSGLSERTVSDLERGLRAKVYPATARQLAAALAVDDDRLSEFLLQARGVSREDHLGAETTAPGRRPFLPFRLTRLIGRERELASILALLRDPDTRLVTVVGPGGVGKTRLAAEVAALLHEERSTAIYFVSLSDVDDAALVLPAIATAVGLQPAPVEMVPMLARRLGADGSLVVLDTFEHLLEAATDVGDLVAACPGLTVLTTSRSAMNLRGEREVPLQPLVVEGEVDAATATSPAVALFLERATGVTPGFRITPATLTTVHDICQRLDGLPLAIELAAARLKHMPLGDLQQNLDHRLDRLVGGARDLPPRHQTMRAALDWSYALLGGPELRLFRSLAVFRGGFDQEAVEAVVPVNQRAGGDNVATLGALVNASLVVVESGVSGRGRYRLLDLVREYAMERAVAAGEVDALRRRHAQYFLAIAERAEPELRGADQREWHAQLLEDEANFRAALAFALDAGEAELALRLAGALWMFWRWAGLFREGRGWLEAAVAAGSGCSAAIRLQALWGMGWLAYHQGDHRRTAEAGRQILELVGEHDDALARRNGLTLIGNAALAEGQPNEAIATLSEALSASDTAGSGWHIATSLLNLGTAELGAGRTADARQLLARALTLYEELGDRHFTARTLIELGYAALADNDEVGAATHIQRAMEISAELDDAWSIAEGLEAVACLRSRSAPDTAALLSGAAERLRDQISMRPHPPDAVIHRAHMDVARTRLGTAAFDEAWAKGRDAPRDALIEVALAAST
jgi:predicted ATPase/DNA-binding XRE family transcriptional regulator